MNMDSSEYHHQNLNSNWRPFSLSNTLFQNPHHHHDTKGTTTSLSILADGSPKLADFLAGCGSVISHFPDESQASMQSVYDSELKKIAAGSLLSGVVPNNDDSQLTEVAPIPPQRDSSPAKKAFDTFGQRTSIYRGVTRHRWTGRYEAHLWDNSCRREGQSRKGRQVYLGGYDKEDKAARAYDLAALKYWGPTTTTNFSVSNYGKELEEMKNMTRQEFVASLRRKSSGFSRGASIYRGVTRHHQHGRWQARIGRVAGNKDLYLGTFSTQEAAAEAYDIAAIKFRGLNAVTNFDMSRYDVKMIANKNLPIGGMCSTSKITTDQPPPNTSQHPALTTEQPTHSSILSFALPKKNDPSTDYWDWTVLGYNQNYQCTTYPYPSSANNNGYYNGGGFIQQEKENNNGGIVALSTSSSIPVGTPVGLNGSSYGNWIEQSFHSYQPAKQNLSVIIKTPIFGIE
ncbi:hypothetical protein R6Q57_020430 [Mikania cordata]